VKDLIHQILSSEGRIRPFAGGLPPYPLQNDTHESLVYLFSFRWQPKNKRAQDLRSALRDVKSPVRVYPLQVSPDPYKGPLPS